MFYTWKRPADVPYPSIWHKFKTKDLNTDEMVNYFVQDLPEERFDDALEFLQKSYIREEVTFWSLNLINDAEAAKELVSFWRTILQQKMCIVCFREGTEEIVGMNITCVSSISDPKGKSHTAFNTKKVQQLFRMDEYIASHIDIHKLHNVSEYLMAYGLSVDPKYRKRGIGTEILRARIPLAQACNITLTSTQFTSNTSIHIATEAGFISDYQVSFDELAEAGIVYPNTKGVLIKQMALHIPPKK